MTELEAIKWILKHVGMNMYVGHDRIYLTYRLDGKFVDTRGENIILAVRNMQYALADMQRNAAANSPRPATTQDVNGIESTGRSPNFATPTSDPSSQNEYSSPKQPGQKRGM